MPDLPLVTSQRRPPPPASRRRPVSVAYVVHAFEMGGYERCVAHLANHLDRRRVTPAIICLENSGAAERWVKADDVEIVELHKRQGNDWRVIRGLANVLRQRRIDVVHSHNWGTLLETALARKLAGVPRHVHAERGTVLGGSTSKGLRALIRGRAMRWALWRADSVVSNAAAVAARVQEKSGFPSDRIRLIANGIERPHVESAERARREIRAALGLSDGAFVVGSVGRLHPVKGFGLAVRAVAALVERGVDVHLVVVGNGTEREPLLNLSAKLAVAERVHLVGRHTEVGSWLTAMDVYINTSYSEGMSQSLVEAMSLGLPLVVTDVGDNAKLAGRGEPCGIVVPPDDVHALAAAVDELHHDGRLRATFGRIAHQRYAASFDIRDMTTRYESLYASLVAGDDGDAVAVGEFNQRP